MANISGVLGEMFRFIYAKIICRPCRMIQKRRELARKSKVDEENSDHPAPMQSNGWMAENDDRHKSSLKKSVNPMTPNSILDEDDPTREERVAVPLTVTMIIIAAYIWIGSALFHNFEGWTMIQAGYFCFITLGKQKKKKKTLQRILKFVFLATIGFGDFVSK